MIQARHLWVRLLWLLSSGCLWDCNLNIYMVSTFAWLDQIGLVMADPSNTICSSVVCNVSPWSQEQTKVSPWSQPCNVAVGLGATRSWVGPIKCMVHRCILCHLYTLICRTGLILAQGGGGCITSMHECFLSILNENPTCLKRSYNFLNSRW